jgi:hypothetical protein
VAILGVIRIAAGDGNPSRSRGEVLPVVPERSSGSLGSLLVRCFFRFLSSGRYPYLPGRGLPAPGAPGDPPPPWTDTRRTVVVHVRLPRILGPSWWGRPFPSPAATRISSRTPWSPGHPGGLRRSQLRGAWGCIASLGWSGIQAAAFALGLFAWAAPSSSAPGGRIPGGLVLGGMVVSASSRPFSP